MKNKHVKFNEFCQIWNDLVIFTVYAFEDENDKIEYLNQSFIFYKQQNFFTDAKEYIEDCYSDYDLIKDNFILKSNLINNARIIPYLDIISTKKLPLYQES